MQEVIKCINCQQKLRIPKYHPLIKLKCPTCKAAWEIPSNLQQGSFENEEALDEAFSKAYKEKSQTSQKT